jgi:O-antigen/teichoic acid export membrane protein
VETNDGKTAERRRMVLQNSVVEVLTYGATQALRLGSNLILTRLLFPEAFGLMVVVGIVLFGLTMLSDVGILQAVIQNPRGDDEDFLNTAWTLQIMRGGLLCVLTWCIAYPASLFFDKPELFGLLLAAGGQLVIAGFESRSADKSLHASSRLSRSACSSPPSSRSSRRPWSGSRCGHS